MLASWCFSRIFEEFGRFSKYFRSNRPSTDGAATASAHNSVIVRTDVVCNRGQRSGGYGLRGRITFAASAGDIIGFAGVPGNVDTVPGVLTMTRVTPFDVTTDVVVRPSELTCDVPDDAGSAGAGGAGGALLPGVADVTPATPDVTAPGAAAP